MKEEDLTEDDWKVVEARLQQDIDNGQGDKLALAFIWEEKNNGTRN